MDRALKERIIGAIVLVVLAVLIVPVFLDGPAGDGTGTVTRPVLLPGQNEQPRKQQTIVLERDRSQPVPAAAAPADPQASGDEPEEARPLPEPVPQPVPDEPARAADSGEPASPVPSSQPAEAEPAGAAAADSETGLWAVQLGSFSNRDNAERLAAELRESGYAAFLSRLQADGKDLHRVRVGPQSDRESAESVAARLNAAGHPGQVVPHP